MIELLLSPDAWIAFFTLTALELVLGIDNIIFISILVDRLEEAKRDMARRVGLFLAMFMRIALLLLLAWIVGLTAPLFSVVGMDVSGRDLIMLSGGLFLLWKSVGEIHELLEGGKHENAGAARATVGSILLQIMLIDLVFSLDSIITAVGLVKEIPVMIAAVVTSVGLMMVFAGSIGRFVSDNPTIKMLALAFLVVVGVVLIADGFGTHVPKGYIYFAMAFSVAVEMLNLRLRIKKGAAAAYGLHKLAETGDAETRASYAGHKSKLAGFIIDCQTDDLKAATEFWSKALGYSVSPTVAGDAEKYQQLMTGKDGLHIEIQKVDHASHVHLDIETNNIEAEVSRLEKLGAQRIEQIKTWWVMQAPTGQRFCVVKPQSIMFEQKATAWA